jgi:short subunit fatty acids transporter
VSTEIDPAIVSQLIERSTQELAVRSQELALHAKQDETRRLEIDRNAEYAHASLAAQERDLQDQRKQYNHMLKSRYWFIMLVLVIMCLFGGYAIQAGAKDLLIEIMKIGLAFAAGGFGGYQWGKNKQNDK